jgi:adenylosuccinate lyase
MNLWHERDISHSSVERIIFPDSTMLLYYMLVKMIEVVEGLVVNKQNILKNLALTHGLIYSQRALLKLVESGLTREEAYKAVQTGAMKSWKTGADFKKLLQQDTTVSSKIRKSQLDAIFNPKNALKHVDYIFRKAGIK